MKSITNLIWPCRIISLCAISLVTASMCHWIDDRVLKKMDYMSSAAFMEYERNVVHGHSYWSLYLILLIFGTIFFCAVELVSHGLNWIVNKNNTA